MLAFLQDVLPGDNRETDWSTDEKFGIWLVFQEVRMSMQTAIEQIQEGDSASAQVESK